MDAEYIYSNKLLGLPLLVSSLTNQNNTIRVLKSGNYAINETSLISIVKITTKFGISYQIIRSELKNSLGDLNLNYKILKTMATRTAALEEARHQYELEIKHITENT